MLDHASGFAAEPDATLTLTKSTLAEVQLGERTLDQAIDAGAIRVDGRREAVGELFALLDTPEFWFPIVTP